MPPLFEDGLAASESQWAFNWWEPHYRAAWPDMLPPLHRYKHHPSKIDTVVLKTNPPHGIRVDEKLIFKKPYPHIALELYHRKPDGQQWPGWARDRESQGSIDVVFYGVTKLRRSYILPLQRLLELDQLPEGKEIMVPNPPQADGRGGYHTHCLLVFPNDILPLIGGRAVEPETEC